MTKTFQATYITTKGTRNRVQFRVDVPENEENIISYAGRYFIEYAIEHERDSDFVRLISGRHAIVEVTD